MEGERKHVDEAPDMGRRSFLSKLLMAVPTVGMMGAIGNASTAADLVTGERAASSQVDSVQSGVSMRIDVHTHGLVKNLKASPAEYIAECRKAGIERVCLIENFDDVFEAYEKFPKFVVPIARFPIDMVTPREINLAFDRGAKGIKFINPRFSYGDNRYDRLYDTISDRGGVMVFHTGYLGKSAGTDPKKVYTDITLMRPAAVDRVTRRHPKLRILMAHYGNPWWEEAWKIAFTNTNVYADLCGGTAFTRAISMWKEMFAPDGVRDDATLSKLLFATDVHVFEDGYTNRCQPYFSFYDRMMSAVGATAEQREQINRGTAIKLFKLDA